MKKSAAFLSILFAAILICGLTGYIELIGSIIDTITGVNTIDIHADETEGDAGVEGFILEDEEDEYALRIESFGVMDRVTIIEKRIEGKLNTILPAVKEAMININGGFQRLIGRTIFIDAEVEEDVVLTEDGYLTRLQAADISIYEKKAREIIELNAYLAKKDIPLLFSFAPYKIEQVDIPVHRNEIRNKEYIMKTVGEAGIPVINWTEEMELDGKEFFSMYYKTDHHWKAESGLWAAGVIAEYCAENYGFSYDKSQLDPDKYSYEVLDDWFLGSYGKRVGTLVAGVDDFTVIHPNFETNFDSGTMNEGGKWEYRSGTLEEAMYWNEYIENRDYFNKEPYGMYSRGDNPIQIIHNNNAPNNKRILVVKHSFADVTMPFLALACEEINVVDLRHAGRPLNLYEYIGEYNPDLVMFLW